MSAQPGSYREVFIPPGTKATARVIDEQIAAMDRREMLDGAVRWARAGGWFSHPLEQNIGPDSNHAVPAVTIHAIRREFSRRCAESGYRYVPKPEWVCACQR